MTDTKPGTGTELPDPITDDQAGHMGDETGGPTGQTSGTTGQTGGTTGQTGGTTGQTGGTTDSGHGTGQDDAEQKQGSLGNRGPDPAEGRDNQSGDRH